MAIITVEDIRIELDNQTEHDELLSQVITALNEQDHLCRVRGELAHLPEYYEISEEWEDEICRLDARINELDKEIDVISARLNLL